jgi:hypothetical protein
MPPRGVRPKVAEVRDVDIVASCVRILKRFTHPPSIYPPASLPRAHEETLSTWAAKDSPELPALFGKSDFALA